MLPFTMPGRLIVRAISALTVAVCLNSTSFAQSYIYATGAPSFSTVQPVESGFIDVANGNLHLEIPLASPPQRGSLTASAKLVYDSRIWQPSSGVWWPNNVPGSMLGWQFISPASSGPGRNAVSTACDTRIGHFTTYTGWYWTDRNGTVKQFSAIETEYDPTGCDGGGTASADAFADDSSGFHMYVTNYTSAKVYAPDGTQVYPTWTDTNGNSFSRDGNGNTVDTLGRTPVAYSTNGTNQNYYDVLGSDGNTHRVTVTYANQTATSAFTQYTNQSVNQNAITRIDLPDGSNYQFVYDSWGELSSVTLPTGGQINYGYTTFTDPYGNQNRWISTRTVNSGTPWNFSPAVVANNVCQALQTGTINGCQQVTVAKPAGESIVYTFSLNGGAWNSQAVYKNNGGATVATVTNLYDLSNTCTLCGGATYVRTLTSTTQLPSVNSQTLSKQTQYTYDSIYNGNITAVKEWNFITGSTFGPTPDRETDVTYLNATQYISANITNRPLQATTYAGSTTMAQTKYIYDTATSLQQMTGITHHDDTNYGTGNTTRGNVTQVQKWISGSTYWNTTLTYDMTGQLRQSQDNSGNITYFDYTDHYYSDNGANPPVSTSPPNGPTNAYPTTITLPIIGSQTLRYYFGSGKMAFGTDQNGASNYMHYQDPLDRFTQSSDAIGGWQLESYASRTQQDVYSALTSTTPATNCSSCRHDEVLLDNLGRLSHAVLINDPDGQINQVTSYDVNGRASSTTNPYRSNTESTYGATLFMYDGLDRVTQITLQDNNTVTNSYGAALPSATSSICGVTAYPSTITDEAGKKRLYWKDGFGRLVEVDEPDGSGNFTIGTCYQYDVLDNLQTAIQHGGSSDNTQWRTRSYYYDALSRLIQATTPEAGTVTYSYTNSGSPCSGNLSLACSRTDARNVVTTYSYDALNRLTAKTYTATTPATPAVSYYYDQPSYNGLTITNGKGRRTGMSDGTGQTAWSYDAAGNVLTKRQTIAGVTNNISYTYNLDGSVATMTTPNGHVYTYGYSNALRPVSVVDNGNGYTYVQNAHYAAAGLLTSAAHGLNLGITETNNFNNRLQPTLLSATGGQTVLSLSYNWTLPGGVNNGSVYQIQNNRDTSNNRSFQYTYDNLNRLLTAGTMAGASTPWSTTYSYDGWGNLYQKSTSGPGEPSMGPLIVDVHNHVNPGSYSYDAAGNLTFDGVNSLLFDAENRLNPSSGYVYSYDGDDHRVEKNNAGSITYYWYDDNFNVISTTGNIVRDYVYFDGRRVAYYSPSSGNQHYYWSDHLGSARTMSNSSGSTIEWEGDYYPFGSRNVLNNYLDNYFLFTDYEFDYELGDYYADHREQSPVLGRFFSPDPILGDPSNPQSLNRYAYVLNNPTSFLDPLGLDCQQTSDYSYYCPVSAPLPSEPSFFGFGGAGGGASSGGPAELEHGPFGDDGGGGGGGGDDGNNSGQQDPKAPLSPKDQSRLDKAKKQALDDIFSADCMAFCLSHGINPTNLAVAVLNQHGYNGRNSTITQAAAGTGIDYPSNTVASGFRNNPGVNAAASITGSFDVYYRPGGLLSSGGINEGTVEHEAVHNLTKKTDTQLQALFGITINPYDTTNITQALKDHHCAH